MNVRTSLMFILRICTLIIAVELPASAPMVNRLSLFSGNATHWVSQTQWDNFMHPNVRESDSYSPKKHDTNFDGRKIKISHRKSDGLPWTRNTNFQWTYSRAIGKLHQTGNKTLVYVGDVIPLAANVPLSWISSYDVFPLTAMEEKGFTRRSSW